MGNFTPQLHAVQLEDCMRTAFHYYYQSCTCNQFAGGCTLHFVASFMASQRLLASWGRGWKGAAPSLTVEARKSLQVHIHHKQKALNAVSHTTQNPDLHVHEDCHTCDTLDALQPRVGLHLTTSSMSKLADATGEYAMAGKPVPIATQHGRNVDANGE